MGQSDLPLGGGEAHAKAFERAGWCRGRPTSGKNPHIVLIKEGVRATLSIPNHKRDVSRRIIQTLIQLAGITEAEYCLLFKGKSRPDRPRAR